MVEKWNLTNLQGNCGILSAQKSKTSMSHYNLVRKFSPMPQAMKIPDAKVAVDKEWKKLRQIQHEI